MVVWHSLSTIIVDFFCLCSGIWGKNRQPQQPEIPSLSNFFSRLPLHWKSIFYKPFAQVSVIVPGALHSVSHRLFLGLHPQHLPFSIFSCPLINSCLDFGRPKIDCNSH